MGSGEEESATFFWSSRAPFPLPLTREFDPFCEDFCLSLSASVSPVKDGGDASKRERKKEKRRNKEVASFPILSRRVVAPPTPEFLQMGIKLSETPSGAQVPRLRFRHRFKLGAALQGITKIEASVASLHYRGIMSQHSTTINVGKALEEGKE